jgi:hypothetical protein
VASAIPGAELRKADVKGVEVIAGSDQPKIQKLQQTTTPTAKPGVTPTTKTAMENICKK